MGGAEALGGWGVRVVEGAFEGLGGSRVWRRR